MTKKVQAPTPAEAEVSVSLDEALSVYGIGDYVPVSSPTPPAPILSESPPSSSSSDPIAKPKKSIVKRQRKKGGPKLTNKVNPSWEFPEEPEDFKSLYQGVKWGSDEHDELGKKLFKEKKEITHSDVFSKHFPRYSVVKANNRASNSYARRRFGAWVTNVALREGANTFIGVSAPAAKDHHFDDLIHEDEEESDSDSDQQQTFQK